MNINHIPPQYKLQEDTKVWIRFDYQGMGYSDGDETEERIKQLIDQAEDISVMSVELANHCSDWPTTYHLSRKRSNLFRPFEKQLQGKSVLEIGSGCGAITRYLGEAGSNITALEGSPRRASITASRCRDLENVSVLSDNFSQFQTDQQYDVVTLIGVLEYARSFVENDDPVAYMLEKAKQYLKPNGVLIIAIENQLGLKYFAGYPEDHLGKPMYGVEEHYGSNTAVTFGKQELSERVAEAGLLEQRWWYPFPDYKMPSLLVSEKGANAKGDFDLTTLVRGASASDAQTPNGVSFIQERAWKPIIKNGLLEDMANSFVLLASATDLSSYQTNHLAHHYASERRIGFAKQVVFEFGDSRQVITQQLPLYAKQNSDTETVKQVLQQDLYIVGQSWHDQLTELMSTPDWSVDTIAEWWGIWWNALQAYALKKGMTLTSDTRGVDPVLIDAMPRNLFYQQDNIFEFIDLEWQYFQPFSAKFLAFRALFSSFQSLGVCAKPLSSTPIETSDLIYQILLSQDMDFSEDELKYFVNLESDIQLATGGKKGFSWEQYRQSAIRVFDTLTPAFEKIHKIQEELLFSKKSVLQKEKELVEKDKILIERDKELIEKDKELIERSNCIARIEHKVEEKKIEIKQHIEFRNMILNSTSWKVTKPIRGFKYLLSGHYSISRVFPKQLPSILQRGKQTVDLVGQLGKASGGFHVLLKRLILLYRKEGIKGVRRTFTRTFANNNNYQDWIWHYDTLHNEVRQNMRLRIKEIANPPLMSIVMPTYNPNPDWLIEAIESVQNQIYPHWELCIADDVSPDPKIRQILEDFTNKDKRIKVVFREENGHISAASNSALEVAEGDWIVLMDHDDLIAEDALYWLADTIDRFPETRLIYSDEDKIDENGNRHLPYFKCDWNLDLFYSQNMFSHLGALETNLMRSVDGFRIGLEGSQDYDLVLRCMEKIGQHQIRHVPKVLYHWRVHEESTSSSNDAKPYVVQAAERALDEHFDRTGVKAKSEFIGAGYRVHFALPEKTPSVHLCMMMDDSDVLLEGCLSSIFEKTNYPNFNISIVSHKQKPENIDQFNHVNWVVAEKTESVYDACNGIVENIDNEIVGFIAPTVEVINPDWLIEMVSQACRDEVGAVGAKLLYSDNTVKHGGIVLGMGSAESIGYAHHQLHKENNGYAGRLALLSSFSAVSLSCILIQRSIFMEAGGLKSRKENWSTWTNIDFCLNVIDKGYRNVWTPYAELYDHAELHNSIYTEEHRAINERWKRSIEYDPAYSPNLTLEREDFTYAWPPRVFPF